MSYRLLSSSILLLFLSINCSQIDAIQPSWPFKIDYILLEKNYVYMDGGSNNAALDPGSRTVYFSHQLFATPNNIIFGICKLYNRESKNYVRYSMTYSGMTDIGFVLHTNFPQDQWKDVLISYMTVFYGYGIEVQRVGIGSMANSVVNGHKMYTMTVTTMGINLEPGTPTSQFIMLYTHLIDVDSFAQSDIYTTNYTITSATTITPRIYIPQTSTLNNLGITVSIMHYPTISSTLTSFDGYYFQGSININVVDNVVILFNSTNSTSTLYLLAAPTTGGFVRSYNYAFTFGGTPVPNVGGFTVDFMRSRGKEYNMIETRYFGGSPTVSDSVFAYVRLERVRCSGVGTGSGHPYLMLIQQKCHDVIPSSYYANTNKQLNPCSQCTNIVDCEDCMDTMCAASQFLNPPNFACIPCSNIDSDCEYCRNGSCTKCFISSEKVVDTGACVSCNSGSYFDPTTSTCILCTNIDPNCQLCNNGICSKCLVSSLKVLEGGVCVDCNSTDYFSTGLESCVSCVTMDLSCEECSQGLGCIKCFVSSKKVVEGGSCVVCNQTDYYDAGSRTCVSCTGIDNNCQQCDGIVCLKCFTWSQTVIVGGLCERCLDGSYYGSSNQCESCADYNADCQLCNSSQCLSCAVASKTIISSGSCVPCQSQFYYNPSTKTCDSCHLFNCLECSNQTYCINCISDQFQLLNNYCVFKQKIDFTFEAFIIAHSENTIQAYVHFNNTISIIQSNYQPQFTLLEINQPFSLPATSHISSISLEYLTHNNTLKSTIYFTRSLNLPTLYLNFTTSLPYPILSKTSSSCPFSRNIYIINSQQKQIYAQIQAFVNSFVEHSGIIFTTLSLTDTSALVVNLLWSAQLTSYYIFLPIAKPKNLLMFLNMSFELLNIDILPFSIPNPLENSTFDVKPQEIFQEYNIDIYFLRACVDNIIYMVIFGIFYYILKKVFEYFQNTNVLVVFGKSQFVKKFYNNVSSMAYSYLTVLSFSAAVAMTVKRYNSVPVTLNYFSALIFLFLTLSISAVHPLVLFLNRKSMSSYKNCYLRLNDEKYSQLILLLYILSQVLIPILIPLSHPIFTVSAAISLQCINIKIANQAEKHIDKWFRIIKACCYILFNLVMVGLFILEKMYSMTGVEECLALGYIGIVCMVIVFMIDIVELFTGLIEEMYNYVKSTCFSKKVKINKLKRSNKADGNIEKSRSNKQLNLEDTDLSQNIKTFVNYSFLQKLNECQGQQFSNTQSVESDIKLIKKQTKSSKNQQFQKEEFEFVRLKSSISESSKRNNTLSVDKQEKDKRASQVSKVKYSKFSYQSSKLHRLKENRKESKLEQIEDL